MPSDGVMEYICSFVLISLMIRVIFGAAGSSFFADITL
jgi:hypothetical protein